MYTESEIQQSISRYLQTSVELTHTPRGTRDVVRLHDEVFGLLVSALLLRPDSIFYALQLTSNRVEAMLSEQVSDLNTIQDLLPRTADAERRLDSVSGLVSAESAAISLGSGLRQRGLRSGVGPASKRFDQASTRVLEDLRSAVVRGGQVVRTPGEARDRIRVLHQDVLRRHSRITESLSRFVTGIQTLRSTKLPETAVQGLVQRVRERIAELTDEAESGSGSSRQAMLDLVVARSLIRKVSGSLVPALKRVPVPGGSSAATLVEGTRSASVSGTVSAPLNYARGTELDLEVAGSPLTLSLPRGSEAEVVSGEFSGVTLESAAELAVRIDRGQVYTVSWSDGITLSPSDIVDDLNAALGSAGQAEHVDGLLRIRSSDSSDASHIEVLTDTAERQYFVEAVPIERVGTANPVEAEEVRQHISSQTGSIQIGFEETDRGTFDANTRSGSGNQNRFFVDRMTGTATFTGTALRDASQNFVDSGVETGDLVTIVGTSVVASVQAVTPNQLDLDSDEPDHGSVQFIVAPDIQASSGDRIQFDRGPSANYYRVVSSESYYVDTDRPVLPRPDTGRITVFRETSTLSATGTSESDTLEVVSSNPMGFPVTVQKPGASALRVTDTDLTQHSISPGDTVYLNQETRTITAVQANTLRFEPPITFQPVQYEVRGSKYLAYDVVREDTEQWLRDHESFPEGLNQYIRRVLLGNRATEASTSTHVVPYAEATQAIWDILDSYVVGRERSIDAVIQTFSEQGFDRAADLFVEARYDELFSIDPDDASYSTRFMRQAADTSRSVAPVSRHAESPVVGEEVDIISERSDDIDV